MQRRTFVRAASLHTTCINFSPFSSVSLFFSRATNDDKTEVMHERDRETFHCANDTIGTLPHDTRKKGDGSTGFGRRADLPSRGAVKFDLPSDHDIVVQVRGHMPGLVSVARFTLANATREVGTHRLKERTMWNAGWDEGQDL